MEGICDLLPERSPSIESPGLIYVRVSVSDTARLLYTTPKNRSNRTSCAAQNTPSERYDDHLAKKGLKTALGNNRNFFVEKATCLATWGLVISNGGGRSSKTSPYSLDGDVRLLLFSSLLASTRQGAQPFLQLQHCKDQNISHATAYHPATCSEDADSSTSAHSSPKWSLYTPSQRCHD